MSSTGPQQDAVGRDGCEAVTVDAEDVTHDDICIDDVDLRACTNDGLGVGLVESIGESNEGELLDVVDGGRDEHHNEDAGEDGTALDPAGAAGLAWIQPDGGLHGDGDDAEHEEHDEHEILNGLPAELEKAVELLSGDDVGPEELLAPLDVLGVRVQARLGTGAQREAGERVGSGLAVFL
mmetsp:Transcript_3389/g.6170  ORF Transcript_3389/g.6170 Transcript_3389/m.6170 type:complete len:180 (-) Transcript_3389:472-1011(-)